MASVEQAHEQDWRVDEPASSRRGGFVGLLRAAQHVTRARSPQGDVIVVDPSVEGAARSRRGPSGLVISFVLLVVLPSILATVYFGWLASDQYMAEMRFVVRGGQAVVSVPTKNSAGVGSGTGATEVASANVSDDPYIISSYIHSPAIVDDIAAFVDLRTLFRRPEADRVARLKDGATRDDLYDYWRGMVASYVDVTSGIDTVQVRAFRPEDAVAIAAAIEKLSERLVNDMSDRARRDAIGRAEGDVTRAQAGLHATYAEMQRYRNAEGVIDPVKAAGETSKLLTQVMADKLMAENQLFVSSRSLDASSPVVQTLKSKVDSLNAQIADLKGRLAGNPADAHSVASVMTGFQELAVRQKLAESLFSLAENGLERARQAAEAQSIYLTVFVPPSLPENSSYPRRVAFPILVVISLIVLWSIGALIRASVEDHRL